MKIKGTIIGLLLLSVLLILAGCTGGGGGGLCVGGVVEKLDDDSIFILVAVLEGSASGDPVADATLSINGTSIAGMGGLFLDLGTVPTIADGADVLLEVTGGGSTVSATVVMPEKPVITLLTENLTVVGAVNATWTSTTDPDIFGITVLDTYSAVGNYTVSMAGNARGYSMVGVFDTGVPGKSYFNLSALNQAASFVGDAASDSEFGILNTTESPGFYAN